MPNNISVAFGLYLAVPGKRGGAGKKRHWEKKHYGSSQVCGKKREKGKAWRYDLEHPQPARTRRRNSKHVPACTALVQLSRRQTPQVQQRAGTERPPKTPPRFARPQQASTAEEAEAALYPPNRFASAVPVAFSNTVQAEDGSKRRNTPREASRKNAR